MARYAMVTNLRLCVGCQACTVACNAEWQVPAGQARTRVSRTPLAGSFPHVSESVFVAQCNHCDRAPCVEACPSGATRRSDSGVVVIDHDVCIGCGFCVDACPYDARHIDRATGKADKCSFCEPRVSRGRAPACVETCPAQAKQFGDLEDAESPVFRLVFEQGAFRIETAAVAVGPHVFYTGTRDQIRRVAEVFPPREPRLPAAGRWWSRGFGPLMAAVVGATFVGQAVAFFLQLRNGEQDFEE